ncbi:MAG: homocysteine S-methyltransferase family protein [Oscillospiraceae bacterium]|jgi:5-methyltetrahydrofolate--homocysteine methyltransferase|nr:homocysteine S-methyltransferase family protein [Oscillospiraceae bacterium]
MERPIIMAGGIAPGTESSNGRLTAGFYEPVFAPREADIVCAPTFAANVAILRETDHDSPLEDINRDIVAAARAAASPGTLIAGGIGPCGEHGGDMFDLIDMAARQAWALESAGADALFIDAIPGLGEARAAVIGARPTGLPLYVCLSAGRDGDTQDGGSFLAALVCLQALGVAGFGLSGAGHTDGVSRVLDALRLQAQIPLIAPLDRRDPAMSACNFLEAGAGLLICGAGMPDDKMGALRELIRERPCKERARPESADTALCLCDGAGLYYLNEGFSLSDPLTCSLDMAPDILEAENLGADALLLHIETPEDADFFSRNTDIIRGPVCLRAQSAEVLELALAAYCGRAIVDARSNIRRDDLDDLARAYGGIVR